MRYVESRYCRTNKQMFLSLFRKGRQMGIMDFIEVSLAVFVIFRREIEIMMCDFLMIW